MKNEELKNNLLQYHIINETGVENMLIDNRPVKHTGSRQYHIILSKDISKIKSRRSFYKTFPRNTIRFDMFENIFLRREIKITPVMTQPYIIDIFQILPSPIQTGQFTISFILTAYIVLGNFMTKAKRNAVVGVRTVWSMHNDNTWRKSNRFGAICIIITGLLTIITTVFTSGMTGTIFMLIYLLLATIVTVVYSKKIYDKEIKK